MARVAFLLLCLTVFSSEVVADPFCRFYVDATGRYSCDLYDANIQSESDVLVFEGVHIPGYGDSRVTRVYIDVSSTVRVLNNEICVKFGNLEYLTIASVQLERFSNQAFGPCSQLTELIVAQNPLSTLQANIFENSPRLVFLMFINALNNISRESFHGLYNLEGLFLSDNNITSLDAGIFEQNPALTFIALGFNKLTIFHPYTFGASVEYLILRGNPIEEIDEIIFANADGLRQLDLSYCAIRTIHPDAFRNTGRIQYLDLRGNNLESFASGTFTALSDLLSIDLSYNHINRLNTNTFGFHPIATNFNIDHNGLNEIEKGFFNVLPNLTTISALGNTCVNVRFSDMTMIPAELAECYANWIAPTTSSLATTSSLETTSITPASTTESTTEGAASVKVSMFLIFYLLSSIIHAVVYRKN